MKFLRFILFTAVLIGAFNANAQLNVNNAAPNNNPAQLVTNVLQGGGLAVSGVVSSGNSNMQIGYYTNGTTAVGSASGIIISTGNVSDAALPNDSTATSTDLGGAGSSDADVLSLAAGRPVFDSYILEFDVSVTGDELSLKYVFASEEYQEYVCSADADVFAILVSGPGISGSFSNNAQNIAVLPSSGNDVGINSVNNGIPGIFGSSGGCVNSAASPYYHDNTDTLFEFDGYTSVMTATATVQCNETYHIKIIITDVGDADYDSGILLQERSLFSNGNGVFDNGGGLADSVIVEGCRGYDLIVYNSTGFQNGEVFNLQLGGNAVNGTDYQNIPTSYSLTSGDSMLVIHIVPIADGVTEGTDTLTISYYLVSPCGDSLLINHTIYIEDENPLVVTGLPSDQDLCAGAEVDLNLTVSGGFPPYDISWNGVLGNNITDVPLNTTDYFAQIYDQAGCGWSGDFTAFVHPMPVADAGPDLTLCKGTPTTIGANISGEPGSVYLWTPSGQLNSGSEAYPVMNPQFTQSLTVTVTTPFGCSATDNLSVTVLPVPTANAGPDQSIVYLQTSAALSGTGTGTAFWSPDFYLSCTNCFVPDASPTETTTYTLTVTGSNGCTATDEVTVTVEVPTDYFVPSAFSPNGDGNNDQLFVHCYTIGWMNFQVYDMWGQLLFQTNDASHGWDGTVNGQPASVGLYVYTLEIRFVNNAGDIKTGGQVNLVR